WNGGLEISGKGPALLGARGNKWSPIEGMAVLFRRIRSYRLNTPDSLLEFKTCLTVCCRAFFNHGEFSSDKGALGFVESTDFVHTFEKKIFVGPLLELRGCKIVYRP